MTAKLNVLKGAAKRKRTTRETLAAMADAAAKAALDATLLSGVTYKGSYPFAPCEDCGRTRTTTCKGCGLKFCGEHILNHACPADDYYTNEGDR